jgi:outer membrane protein OmpA-like peptidoglycan-associated protein
VIAFIDGNYAEITPLMTKQGDYLPEQFSIECDVYFKAGGYNHLNVLFYDDKSYNGDNIGDLIHWAEFGEYSAFGNASSQYPNSGNFDDRWHHIAISYNKGSIKAYVDQYRVLNIPKINGEPQALTFGVIADPEHPIFLKNTRLAAGGGELYKRVSTEGKIITHGINFDINKSTIKPYSMGTINEIAKLMKENPSLNFSVEGHTDTDGDEAANLKLSKERAEAVKAELVKLGIDASRLSTQGWGESKPLDSSNSPEAKANNRRVEFVKK